MYFFSYIYCDANKIYHCFALKYQYFYQILNIKLIDGSKLYSNNKDEVHAKNK